MASGHRSRRRRTTTLKPADLLRALDPVLASHDCVLGGAAFVVMMQTAHFTKFHHSTLCWRLYSSGLRCVFVERQVSSPPMVISAVRRECPMQRAFAEYDDMIQALAANGPDEPFDVGPLPRGSRRR